MSPIKNTGNTYQPTQTDNLQIIIYDQKVNEKDLIKTRHLSNLVLVGRFSTNCNKYPRLLLSEIAIYYKCYIILGILISGFFFKLCGFMNQNCLRDMIVKKLASDMII